MFFKAGVIGDLEDLRDEKIAAILTSLQGNRKLTPVLIIKNNIILTYYMLLQLHIIGSHYRAWFGVEALGLFTKLASDKFF